MKISNDFRSSFYGHKTPIIIPRYTSFLHKKINAADAPAAEAVIEREGRTYNGAPCVSETVVKRSDSVFS